MKAQLLFMVLQSSEKTFLLLAEDQIAIKEKQSHNFVNPSKIIMLLLLLDFLTASLHQPTQTADNKHSGG